LGKLAGEEIVMASSDSWAHLRGHVLLFDPKPAPRYDASAGLRLLMTVVVLEAVRLGFLKWFYPAVPLLVLIPVFCGMALLAIPLVARVRFSHLGFRSWREWTLTEKSYFLQVLVIANVVFPLVFAPRLKAILSQPNAPSIIATVFVPYLFYGFYQEVVYRGLLQSELVRRWGALAGIMVANLLYTFGPLHWNHFTPMNVPMFASIFAIGLFFGILFQRSGNLWIVAVIHGIGNAYIVTSLGSAR
jgi:membrane protease YdiL (CAAX protease family)